MASAPTAEELEKKLDYIAKILEKDLRSSDANHAETNKLTGEVLKLATQLMQLTEQNKQLHEEFKANLASKQSRPPPPKSSAAAPAPAALFSPPPQNVFNPQKKTAFPPTVQESSPAPQQPFSDFALEESSLQTPSFYTEKPSPQLFSQPSQGAPSQSSQRKTTLNKEKLREMSEKLNVDWGSMSGKDERSAMAVLNGMTGPVTEGNFSRLTPFETGYNSSLKKFNNGRSFRDFFDDLRKMYLETQF